MRTALIVLVAALAVIYIGGGVNVGSNSIFGHIDSVLGIPLLTKLHHVTFFFLYLGTETIEEGMTQTGQHIREFEERPIGFDKKKTYQKLDEASKY